MKGTGSEVGLATVYRALADLADRGRRRLAAARGREPVPRLHPGQPPPPPDLPPLRHARSRSRRMPSRPGRATSRPSTASPSRSTSSTSSATARHAAAAGPAGLPLQPRRGHALRWVHPPCHLGGRTVGRSHVPSGHNRRGGDGCSVPATSSDGMRQIRGPLTMDAALETTRRRTTRRRRRRSRMIRAILAGGLVLGVGTAVTLAAWNDSEFVTGTFTVGHVRPAGLDRRTPRRPRTSATTRRRAPRRTSPRSRSAPRTLSPTRRRTAPFAVRLKPGTTNDGTVIRVT